MAQRKIVMEKKEFLITEMPLNGVEHVSIRHRVTKHQASNVDFNVAMGEVLDKLSEHYGCKVLYKDEIKNL